MPKTLRTLWSLTLVALIVPACADDGDGNEAGEQAGQACADPSECYPDAEPDTLQAGGMEGAAEVICLGNVDGGYCTHTCVTDDDCCAAEGECATDLPQVCAPFENTGMMMCFLTCEGISDGDAYCANEAHPDFICRSTGGGAANRKVCVPNG